MTESLFASELRELYDGELLGEAFFESLLELYGEPNQQYKLCVALQLESETKARLRPYVLASGQRLRDNGEARKTGVELARTFEGKSWPEAMERLVNILQPAVQRYQQIVDEAPPEYKEVATFMLEHEASLLAFASLEQQGSEADAIENLTSQLVFTIQPPILVT